MKALCAVDGSSGSDGAVRLASQLLAAERDEIVFYYAPPAVRLLPTVTASAETIHAAGNALAEKVFERVIRILPPEFRERTTTVTGQQRARDGILTAAKIHRPDLLVVGARGAGRFGLPRLGSVSRSVVHAADVPVLVARERPASTDRPLNILFCCGHPRVGCGPSQFLGRLSYPADAVGEVIHVVESPFADHIPQWLIDEARATEIELYAREFVEAHDRRLEQWQDDLRKFQKTLPDIFNDSLPAVVEGRPGEAIADYVKHHEVDLVVVGGHASSTLARMLTTSTSEYLLSHADCSVLIVPDHGQP